MEAEQKVLDYLFQCYRQNSNQLYDIVPIVGKDSLMLSNRLLKQGWIKDDVVSDGTVVKCALTVNGIRSVDPSFVDSRLDDIMRQTGEVNSIWNVVDLLQAKPEDFQMCFDLANELQNRDLVKLLYAFYPVRVMVEMTLEGVRYKNQL